LASGGVPEEYTAVDDNLVTSAKMTNDDIVEDIISSRQNNNDQSDKLITNSVLVSIALIYF
jgi:hypothetical protein